MGEGLTRRRYLRQSAGLAGTWMLAGVPGLAQVAAGQASAGGQDSLRTHGQAKKLEVGAAVDVRLLRTNESYRRVLTEQYSMVVGENCMKWGALRPGPESFDFNQADELVDFATKHGMKVRGHNLCWHESVPGWLTQVATKANAAEILQKHIATVAGRYKGKIHSWDVVNEAIWTGDGRPDGMRTKSPWFDLLGTEYVEIAFRAARKADPGALLTYNDYGIEYDTPKEQQKRAAVLELVKRQHATKGEDGRPLVDAVGIQSHIRTGDLPQLGGGIRTFSAELQSMGLQVFLTELDVNDDGLEDGDVAQQDKAVAAVYRQYLESLLKDRALTAVVTWGVADDHTWLNGAKFRPKHPTREQRPLPFDKDYAPKPAFYAMRDAIDGAPKR